MKKQIFIDASALKHISCVRKFFNMTVHGYRSKDAREHPMAFGSAIHKFLEAYYKCQPTPMCIKAATDYYRPFHDTLPFNQNEFRFMGNLMKICIEYAKKYKRIHDEGTEETNIVIHTDDFQPRTSYDNSSVVESKFAFVIWSNEHYELVLTGTVDLCCSYVGYDLLLVDHKSTAMNFAKAQSFFDGYSMDIQTMLYSMVYKEKLKLDFYPPVLINGIFVKKPTLKAEKEGVFDGVEFLRSSPIAYSKEQMEQFETWYKRQIDTIITYLTPSALALAYGNFNLSSCKDGFSTCQYFDVCKLPHEFHKAVLESRFETKIYNPLEFR